jgi:HEAT repeat protein
MLDARENIGDDTRRLSDVPYTSDPLAEVLRVSRSFLSESFLERGISADKIGELAASHEEVLGYLLQLTGSPEILVRAAAARALLAPAIANPLAEQQLIIVLDDHEEWVARRAAWSLVCLICSRQGLEVPCDVAEAQEKLSEMSWTPKVQDNQASFIALKNAAKSSDPLIRTLALLGLAGFVGDRRDICK